MKLTLKLKQRYNSLSVQVKAAIWFLFASFLSKGISVITTPIFTRIMPADQYGLLNVYLSWKDIVFIIVCLRLADGYFGPELVKNPSQKREIVASAHGLNLVLVFLWAIIFITLHSFISSVTSLSFLLLMLMLLQIWAISTFELWAKEQRIEYKYRDLVLLTCIVAILRPGLGVIIVYIFKGDAVARIIEMAVVDTIAYSWIFIVSIRKGRCFSYDRWKNALKINIPLIPHYLSQIVLSVADRLMINGMIGKSEAGIYSLAYQISLITVFFNNALLQAMSPWTFDKLKNHEEKRIASIGYFAMILIGVLNLFFIALSPELVSLFAPAQYHEAMLAIPPIAMSVFFQFSYMLFVDIELYYGFTKPIALATTVGAILNVVMNYFFIAKYGYIAAGYTTLICYVFISLIHYFAMRRVCKLELDLTVVYDAKTWLLISTVFVLVGFILLLTYDYISIRLIVIGLMLLTVCVKRKEIIRKIRLLRMR